MKFILTNNEILNERFNNGYYVDFVEQTEYQYKKDTGLPFNCCSLTLILHNFFMETEPYYFEILNQFGDVPSEILYCDRKLITRVKQYLFNYYEIKG